MLAALRTGSASELHCCAGPSPVASGEPSASSSALSEVLLLPGTMCMRHEGR